MKTMLVLTASLTLNLALGVAYCLKPARGTPPPGLRALEVSSPNSPVPVIEKCETNVVTVTKSGAPFDWRTVESEDYKQYVANLRAIGCPEKTLRDILMADVTDLFRERARNSSSNRFEYWKPGMLGNAFDEKRVAQQQAQAKERREILRSLLGEGYSDKTDPAGGQILSPMEQMMGDILNPEKQTAMKALEVKYAGQMLKTAQSGAGEDSEAMRKVMTDKDAEMLTILTPEEKLEYELRLSQPAILLRMSMGQFEPSEEEFRQMFQAAKQATDKFGLGVLTRLGNLRPGDGAANETLDAFRNVLGGPRFLEFQKQRVVASAQK